MLRTFNCGVGMLLVVDRERVAEVANSLRAHEIEPIEVGLIRPRTASAAVKIED
jgi:phosphoribosylaminoimidazole (AIR) synthetase